MPRSAADRKLIEGAPSATKCVNFGENPARSVSANLSPRWSKRVRADMIAKTVPAGHPDLGCGSHPCRSPRLSEVVIAQATGMVR